MTEQEIIELKNSKMSPSELWAKAFTEYNDNRDKKIQMFPLSMNCRPCYFKVLKWHLKKVYQY